MSKDAGTQGYQKADPTVTSDRNAPVESITQRARLDELANQRAGFGRNWTAVVIDRQGDVFGTCLGNGTWSELGSAVPFCLSGRIALPARLVAGQVSTPPAVEP